MPACWPSTILHRTSHKRAPGSTSWSSTADTWSGRATGTGVRSPGMDTATVSIRSRSMLAGNCTFSRLTCCELHECGHHACGRWQVAAWHRDLRLAGLLECCDGMHLDGRQRWTASRRGAGQASKHGLSRPGPSQLVHSARLKCSGSNSAGRGVSVRDVC